MAVYRYRAKKGPEYVAEGMVEAYSERSAVERLSRMGCMPVRLEEISCNKPGVWKLNMTGRLSGGVASGEITIFSRSLASLLRSGVPILEAIKIISGQSGDSNLKIILYDIYKMIKEGSDFSSALMKYPRVFSYFYVALIKAGEDSGSLSDALSRIADYRSKQEEMFSRFRMASAYPILMAVVGIATVVFMLTFVVPRLADIFVNIGQVLPLPTRILISISGFIRKSWILILFILAAAALILKRYLSTEKGRFYFSLLKLRFPVFGGFVFKSEFARFSRALELLIRNGIPILKAINTAIPVLGNEVMKKQLRKSYKDMEQGGSLGRSLKDSNLVPLFVTNLITVGEESGKLGEALTEVADIYERETGEAMKVAANLLEPLMILAMGLIVGFIVVAMLLPIFEINIAVK